MNGEVIRSSQMKHVVLYCKSGRRAAVASEMLSGHGLKNVYCYFGSATEWWKEHNDRKGGREL